MSQWWRKRVLDVQAFPGSEISGVRIYNSTFSGMTKPDELKEADVKQIDCILKSAK